MNNQVRLGIIGMGSVFEPYSGTIRELISAGLASVTLVCDEKKERKERALKVLGFQPKFTTDYRTVINSEDVDAVVILTAMQSHGEIALEALKSGKHVLVEKPMSTSLAEAKDLVDFARKPESPLLVCAPHVVLSPTYQAIWKRINVLKEFGQIMTARARYGWSGPTWGKWYFEPGGGAMFDLGVYNVTSLTGLLGSAKKVTSFAGVAIPKRIVDGEMINVKSFDNMQMVLDFGENVFASITTGFTIQQYKNPAIELYGQNGTIQMLGDDWAPEGYEVWKHEPGTWDLYPEANRNWHWTDGLSHLVECIINTKKPIIKPEHAYHVLEIMKKAQEAAIDGKAKEINSTIQPLEIMPEDVNEKAGKFSHDRRILRREF